MMKLTNVIHHHVVQMQSVEMVLVTALTSIKAILTLVAVRNAF